MVNFDDILAELNDFGPYQKIRYFLICLAALLPPMTTYLYSFTTANPPHRCAHPFLTNDTFDANLTSDLYTNITLKQCSYVYNGTETKCDVWVFDRTYYENTLTEKFTMVCERKFLRSNLQMIYFGGYLVGSFVLGVLADRFGRRPIMFSSFILILVGGIGCAFGPQDYFSVWFSYTIYAFSRFLIAIGTRGINVTGFVLGMEIVGKSKRTFAGIVFEYFFAIGQLILVFVAYFIRDWRTLAWVMIIPCVPFISYYFFIPESPRWLITKKRHDDARKILIKIAKANKTKLNEDSWNDFLDAESHKKDIPMENFINVLKSPILLLLLIILYLNWVINNFLFYGIGLKSSELGSSPYWPFALSAIVELLAYIVTHFVVDKLGRKIPYCTSLFIAGVSCLSIGFYDNKLFQITMAMIGKFSASGAYAIIYMYSTELFPTSIRNSCMGSCSMMARFGSMIAPYVNSLDTWKPLPFMIFGISGIIGALSSLLFPETLNRSIPETIKDAERMSALRCCKKKVDDHNENELKLENSL